MVSEVELKSENDIWSLNDIFLQLLSIPQLKFESFAVSIQRMILLVNFMQKIPEKFFFHDNNFCAQCQTQTYFETVPAI